MEINIRKDRMTKDERWLAMFNRQPLDRIPVFAYALGFCAVYCDLSIADVYNIPEKAYDAVTRTTAEFGWQDLLIILYASEGAWEFGGEIRLPTGEFDQAPLITRHPVETEEDVDKLKVPDVKTAGMVPLMMEVSKLEEKRGAPFIMCQAAGPWSMAGNIAGVDTIARWVIKKPELVHKFVQKILPFTVEKVRYWVDTFGADRVLPGVFGTATASNQLFSPKVVEEFVLPYQKQLCDEIHAMGIKHVFAHICGEQNLNLPYWSQLNFGDLSVVTFDHEVDIETGSKYFPDHIIAGSIDCSIMEIGTPEEIYEATRKLIEQGRKLPNGSFMLAPADCGLSPKASIDNVWALMQAVSDFGWYE